MFLISSVHGLFVLGAFYLVIASGALVSFSSMYLGVQLIYYSWTPLKRYFLSNPIQVLLILNVTVCFFGLLSSLLGGAVLVPLFFFVVGMVSIFYMLVKVSVSLFHSGLASFFSPRINVVSWVLFVVQVVTLAWWFSRWGPVVPPELLLEYTQITEMEVNTPSEILQVLEGGGNPLWLVAIKTAASVLLVITASCLLYYYFGPGGGPGEGGVAGAVVEYGPALLAGEDRRQVMARLFVAMQQRAHAMPFGAFFVGFVAAPLPEGVPLVFVNAYAGPLMLGWDPSFSLLQHFLDEFYVIGRVQVVPEVIMFARPLTPVLVTNITWDLFCVMTKTFLRVCWDPVNLLDCHKIMYFASYSEEWGLPCEVWVHTSSQVFADYLYVNFAGYRCWKSMVWQSVYSNSPSIHLMFGVGETLRKGGVEATQMLEMSLSLTPVEVLATSASVPGFHPVIALLFEGDSVEALRTLVRHYSGSVLLDVGVLEALLYSSYFSEEILQLMWDAVNQGFVPYDYEDGYALDNAVSFDTFFPAHCSVTLLGIVKEGILLQGVASEAEHFFLSGLPAVDLREFVPAEVPYLGLPELEVDPCVAHAQAAVGLVGHLVAEAMFANAVAAAEAGAGAVVEGAVAGVAGLVEDVGAAIMRLPNHNVPF